MDNESRIVMHRWFEEVWNKGSDVGSISESGEFSRFFNPRTDRWAEHFRLDGVIIQPLTVVGEVTARILQFNQNDQILERQALSAVGRYPSKAALIRIEG